MCERSFIVKHHRSHSASAFSTVGRAFDYINHELNIQDTEDHTGYLYSLLNTGIAEVHGFRIIAVHGARTYQVNSFIKQGVA